MTWLAAAARAALLASLSTWAACAQAQPEPAQALREAVATPAVNAALERVRRSDERSVGALIELASIVSPSGREAARAEATARRMRAAGLADVQVDDTPNVVGRIPGTSGRALVFVAMLDDLPAIEALQREGAVPRREGERVVGPATELQSALAALLTAADALVAAGVETRHDLVFAAVAREETGLQGMQALYAQYRDRTVGFVEVLGDGHEIEYDARGAIGWWRVVAHGPEGHTTQPGPSVNQALAEAVSAIYGLPQPIRHRDRHTFANVGILRSGEVFNHRPASGWFSLDLRSDDREIVEAMATDVRALLDRVSTRTGIEFEMQPDFQSLGGRLPGARDSLLTRTAQAVAHHLGRSPGLSEFACCNARVAIAGGTPAVAIQGERGGERATRAEWASIPAMRAMAEYVVLMAATAGDYP